MQNVGATGELTQVVDPNSYDHSYIYNNRGELINLTETTALGIPRTTSYSYKSNGQLEYYTFPNDIVVEYTYNSAGIEVGANLVSGSNIALHDMWLRWDMDPYGQTKAAYFLDQSNMTVYSALRDFDIYGQPQLRKVFHNTLNTELASQSYQFNVHTGNLNYRTDNTRNYTESFSYDTDYDRLVGVSHNVVPSTPVVTTIGYDDAGLGNITKKTDVAVPVIDPSSGQPFPWKYDDYALETIQRQPGAGNYIPLFTQDVTYTPFMKVDKISEASQNEILYTYGPDNQRVMAQYYDKTSGTPVLIQTKYYAQNYERIVDANGDMTELMYVSAAGEQIAILKFVTPFGSSTSTGTVYYTATDHLGSITHIVDDQGTGGIATN